MTSFDSRVPCLALVVSWLASVVACKPVAAPEFRRDQTASHAPPPHAPIEAFCPRRLTNPSRTLLERPCGLARAVLTDGARSATLFGPSRSFNEATAANAVTTFASVRVMPAAFTGQLDEAVGFWVDDALHDESPDLLDMAMQYVAGAPAVNDKEQQIAGDADYGPLTDLGERLEGSDFNDYLGVPWTYADGFVDRPKPESLHSLDCSGYMRILWGFRAGLPLVRGPAGADGALARRAAQMDAASFGVVIIANGADVTAGLAALQAGDLLFFDADASDGTAIDHVGMYLGPDQGGHLRFISSRKGANGPTLGDLHGASVIDGGSLYARSFRSARRL
jgi:hypothetical protein